MITADVFGTVFEYKHRHLVGMDYLEDAKGKLEIVVSQRKRDLTPFNGDVLEIYLPKDPAVIDLTRRAKLYVKITKIAPSLKDKALIRRKIHELVTCQLIRLGKLKEKPRFISTVHFPNKEIQVNVVAFAGLFKGN